MKRRMSVLFTLLALLISSLADRARPSISEAAAPASEQVITLPLFELRIGFKTAFYTTDPNEMAALLRVPKWSYMGIVGYVIPNSKQIPGSVAMYRLTKQVTQHMPSPIPNHTYSNFFFTTDKNEADNAVNNLGWRLEGIAFYVSPKPALGSVELYRLYLPYDGDTGLGDVHLYTASKSEMESTVKYGWTFVRVEAYVWVKQISIDSSTGLSASNPPPAPKKPDLVVAQTIADPTSVTALIRNQGGLNTGGVKYEVSLLIYDKENNMGARLVVPGPGLSPNQTMPVKFDTTKQSVVGKRYQVVVDEPNTIKESEDKNNATEIVDGPRPKIKTGGTPQSSIPLALNLLDVREIKVSSGQLQGKLTAYDLAITNTNKFFADAFQQLTMLPPNPCAGKSSRARLQAEIIWGRDGKDTQPIMRGTCIPLDSAQDLAKMTFSLSAEKGTASLLQVIIHDRLTGIDHKSNVYPVGAFGIAKVLSSVGCFAWLGRADDIACRTPVGMAACENLKAKGKPITCRLVK